MERLNPDILILDLMMPRLNGIEVALRLTDRCPQTKIIILSLHKDDVYIHQALRSGAKTYILKDNAADELVTAIRQVNAGKTYPGAIPVSASPQAG